MWSVSCLLGCCVCLHGMIFVKMVFAGCISVGGENSLCVCSELCPGCFPIDRECVSVLI